ncbi:NAD-dependent epimerase/dehydratase family protein [Xanthomonas arboricola]|uniref:NAD-dependent epimerase/dehydratase family protein n=1 Tax=Xanthomonas arboricola TaxID=56448 RepID=UPI001E556E02|nr:NAD-dependent epimerase/dehydratase family protein [Xanthomonas arboricola]MCC8472502.1 NAD-dependent epimerase/dehydratase family protein [Xanthomonas arboricola]
MIIGNGLLARSFTADRLAELNATVFASGVSNSSETDPAAFEREARLLVKALDEARGRFVYFSTCSVTDPDRAETHYVRHKLRMERLIAERDEYLILRLPQVVGRTDNPHTLSNYLASGIRNAEPLRIWVKAVRCLIDVEDVARVTLHLVERRLETNAVLDLAPPENVTLLELVSMLEATLGKKATIDFVDRGGGAMPDPAPFVRYATAIGIDSSPGYITRLVRKYYGTSDAT